MKKIYLLLILILIFNSFSSVAMGAEENISLGFSEFDPVENILSATAELVDAGSAPTDGTLVLAAYKRGELIAVNASPYTNLSEQFPHTAELKLDSVNGVYVKAFIVDNGDSLTPLTSAVDCDDVSNLVAYGDIIIPDEGIIEGCCNFEDDIRAYNSQVNTWSMEYVPNESANAVGVCSEIDGNSYLSIRGSEESIKHPFAVLGCGGLQKLVVEFDMWSPSFSPSTFTAYDADNTNSVVLLNSDTSGALKSNSQTVGALKADGWVRIKIVIDNTQRMLNFYVDGHHTGENIPMADSSLESVMSIRFWGRKGNNELMFDNVVVYSGNELKDFSQILWGEVDETAVVYNHNTAGVAEFLMSYNVIHTQSGKLYDGSLGNVAKTPYYQDGALYVTLADAERLVSGSTFASSDEYVLLDDYAAEHGKKVTYTNTGTVLVGEGSALLSDAMIKYINAYMTYDRPDSSTLETSFAGQRPRLTLTPQKLQSIVSAYNTGLDKYITSWCASIIADADKYLKIAPQAFVEPVGLSGRLLVPAKTIKERVQKLALAYHLTNNDEYAERAWTEIENACKFPNWHQGINELDSSTMASAVAYGYDWLYNYWTKTDKSRLTVMEDAIFGKQLDQAQEVYHGMRPYGWAVTTNNWNGVCNGYTALAACAVYEADPHKCADIIANAIANSEAALVEFYPNGSWKEGTGYWNGTVEPYAEMFSTVKNIFGSYYNLENTAFLDVTANFVLASAGPTGTNNYNDSNYVANSTTPTMFWFSDVYDNAALASVRLGEFDKGIAEFSVLDLCHYNPDIELSESNLPLDAYFERLELAALRSEWNNPDATYVSFHSGNNLNSAAHSHIDSGTFVLDMLGERFAFDPGSHYYYTEGHGHAPDVQPDDDGATITRWDYYHHVPEGHNCFIINPDRSLGQNIVTNDKIEEFASGENTAFAITSLASAYQGYAKDAHRGIMLSDNRKCVTIRDEIELNDGDNEIYWFMHKSIDNEIEMLDDTSFIMTQNGKRVKVVFVTNADAAIVYEAEPVHMVRTPPPEQETVENLNKLVIKMNASGSVYLQVKFIPLDGTTDNVTIEDISLDNWQV